MTRQQASSPLTAETTIVATDDHMSSEHEDSLILMNLSQGKYFGFDDLGTAVWKELSEPVRIDALAAKLAEQYAAPQETVLADLLTFAERLRGLGLIVAV